MSDTAPIAEAWVRLRPDSSDFASDATDQIQSGLSTISSSLTGTLSGVGKAAGIAFTGGLGIGLAANVSFDTIQTQFAGLLGSVDQAKAKMLDLVQFTQTTPFSLPQVETAAKTLQLFGGNALDTRKNLQTLADDAAATGASITDLAALYGRADLLISSGQGLGRVALQLQRLGLLSGDAAQQLKVLSDQPGTAAQQMDILNASLGRFAGQATLAANTGAGLKQRFEDAFSNLGRIGFEPIYNDLKRVGEAVTSAAESPGFDHIAASFATLAGTVSEPLRAVADNIASFGASLSSGALARGIDGFSADIRGLEKDLTGLGPVVIGVGAALGVGLFEKLPLIGGLAAGISPIVAGFGALALATDDGRKALETLFTSAKQSFGDLAPIVVGLVHGGLDVLDEAFKIIGANGTTLRIVIDSLAVGFGLFKAAIALDNLVVFAGGLLLTADELKAVVVEADSFGAALSGIRVVLTSTREGLAEVDAQAETTFTSLKAGTDLAVTGVTDVSAALLILEESLATLEDESLGLQFELPFLDAQTAIEGATEQLSLFDAEILKTLIDVGLLDDAIATVPPVAGGGAGLGSALLGGTTLGAASLAVAIPVVGSEAVNHFSDFDVKMNAEIRRIQQDAAKGGAGVVQAFDDAASQQSTKSSPVNSIFAGIPGGSKTLGAIRSTLGDPSFALGGGDVTTQKSVFQTTFDSTFGGQLAAGQTAGAQAFLDQLRQQDAQLDKNSDDYKESQTLIRGWQKEITDATDATEHSTGAQQRHGTALESVMNFIHGATDATDALSIAEEALADTSNKALTNTLGLLSDQNSLQGAQFQLLHAQQTYDQIVSGTTDQILSLRKSLSDAQSGLAKSIKDDATRAADALNTLEDAEQRLNQAKEKAGFQESNVSTSGQVLNPGIPSGAEFDAAQAIDAAQRDVAKDQAALNKITSGQSDETVSARKRVTDAEAALNTEIGKSGPTSLAAAEAHQTLVGAQLAVDGAASKVSTDLGTLAASSIPIAIQELQNLGNQHLLTKAQVDQMIGSLETEQALLGGLNAPGTTASATAPGVLPPGSTPTNHPLGPYLPTAGFTAPPPPAGTLPPGSTAANHPTGPYLPAPGGPPTVPNVVTFLNTIDRADPGGPGTIKVVVTDQGPEQFILGSTGWQLYQPITNPFPVGGGVGFFEDGGMWTGAKQLGPIRAFADGGTLGGDQFAGIVYPGTTLPPGHYVEPSKTREGIEIIDYPTMRQHPVPGVYLPQIVNPLGGFADTPPANTSSFDAATFPWAFANAGSLGPVPTLPRSSSLEPPSGPGGLIRFAENVTGGEAHFFVPVGSNKAEKAQPVLIQTLDAMGAFAPGSTLGRDLLGQLATAQHGVASPSPLIAGLGPSALGPRVFADGGTLGGPSVRDIIGTAPTQSVVAPGGMSGALAELIQGAGGDPAALISAMDRLTSATNNAQYNPRNVNIHDPHFHGVGEQTAYTDVANALSTTAWAPRT